MGFLNKLLERPPHEKPFLLLVVGHPAEGAVVPDIQRKSLGEISSFIDCSRRTRRSRRRDPPASLRSDGVKYETGKNLSASVPRRYWRR